MKKIFSVILAVSISGCSVYQAYDRNFDRNVVGALNFNEESGMLEYEVKKAAIPGKGQLGAILRVQATWPDGKEFTKPQRL